MADIRTDRPVAKGDAEDALKTDSSKSVLLWLTVGPGRRNFSDNWTKGGDAVPPPLKDEMAHVIEKWKCEACGDLHNDEWDARECCPADGWKRYVCSKCGADYEWESACDDHIDAAHPSGLKAELEAAGQQRLI